MGIYNQGYIEKASELFKEGKVTYAGQHNLVGGQLFFYWCCWCSYSNNNTSYFTY